MTQKWNLQDIKPAEPRKKRREDIPTRKIEQKYIDPNNEDVGTVRIVDGHKRSRNIYVIAFVMFFIVVGGSFLFSYLLRGAELVVYPRYREPNVNATITAYLTPQPEELSYEIMDLTATSDMQVNATGEETVVEQAEGTILVYNRHTTEPLRLITNTRFEDPNGLVFRLKDSIVVPGYTRDGEDIAPGVVTAEVFASEPGEEYNIGPSNFTIPGFSGSPEFDNVTGESIDNMTGGFNGSRFIVDNDELQTATQALRLDLRNSLLERIESEKPAGFVVFPGATSFTYEQHPAVERGDTMATIKETATLRIPIFKEEDFAAYIAQATVPGYEGSPVVISDTATLDFSYKTATTATSNIANMESLEFTLKGKPLIVWDYDRDQLKADLASKNRTALPSVLGGYPSIERAEAKTKPFWKSSFPAEPDEIEIIEIVKEQE